MSGPIKSKRMPVGEGFAVEFVWADSALRADWSPDLPMGRPHLIPAYQRARHRFLTRVAKQLGARIAVVDV